jgi:putative hydrolase of the HAD superfamily
MSPHAQRGNFLLWDFDGTLAHRPGQWTDTVMAVLNAADLGQGVDRETVRPFLNAGFPWHQPEVVRAANQPADAWWQQLEPVFARAIQQLGRVGHDRASELAQGVRRTYLDSTAWRVYDDVVPALTQLSGLGWRHLILSNHVPELQELMSALGLDRHFQAVYTSATTGVEKPHPEAFRRVIATLPADAAVWMIGDSLDADVRGAEAAGLPAILVRKTSDATVHQCTHLGGVVDILHRKL